MAGTRVTTGVTATFTAGYTFSLDELKGFIAEAESHGLEGAAVTWTAYPGDQRDPAQLTLSVRKS